jgi:integration host factor subunit beta
MPRLRRGSEDDMTKSELIAALSEARPELTRKHAEVVVNTVFDSMRNALAEGDRIEIRGFGSFHVRARSPRAGRNPKSGAVVSVGARRVPHFKVGKELRDRVDGG